MVRVVPPYTGDHVFARRRVTMLRGVFDALLDHLVFCFRGHCFVTRMADQDQHNVLLIIWWP